MIEASDLFREADADTADIILFGSDELEHLRASPHLPRHRAKCVCISETDTPTFALPGLYAANIRSGLTSGRAETMSYFISERAKGNAAVRRMIGQAVEKRYLYSFLGGSNSWARKRLFRRVTSGPDAVVEPTVYYHWTAGDEGAEQERQRDRYARILAQSKFALCPRGCGLSSYRLFESMSLGVAPVIIADGWRPISGVDWSFALFVPEARIGRLEEIVRAHAPEWAERGAAAQAAYERLLSPERIARTVHDSLQRVIAASDPLREALLAPVLAARVRLRDARWAAFKVAKSMALQALSVTRLPSPVELRYSVQDQIAHQKANR